MADGPRFQDEVDPTPDEIRRWACSDELEPMQDWDIVIAELRNLDVLLQLVSDPACPARDYLLGSIYCVVGHCDRDDPRLGGAAASVAAIDDPWVSAWARRVRHVLANPAEFHRDDWCGWEGLRTSPAG